MIIFTGDYIQPRATNTLTEVVDIVDNMTVLCADGNTYTADDATIVQVYSRLEYQALTEATA